MPIPAKAQWTATAQRRDAPLARFNSVHANASLIIWILARHLEAITHMLGCWPGRGWDPSSSEHGTGRALDWMISDRVGRAVTAAQKVVGDLVVAWLIAHADQLRIRHIIWHGRIWKRRYRGTATEWTVHRGSSVSARHEDHIHVFLDNAGGWVPDVPLLAVASPGLPSTGDKPTPNTSEEDDSMSAQDVAELKAYIYEQRRVLQKDGFDRTGLQLLVTEVWSHMITSGGRKSVELALAQSRNLDEAQSAALTQLAGAVQELARKSGVDVAQIAGAFVATVLEEVTPQLQETLRDALAELPVPIDAESIASEVVANLGETITAGVAK